MANQYGVLENNIIVNVIVADSKEVAEEVTGLICISLQDYPEVGIEWQWDGVTFTDPRPKPVIEETVPSTEPLAPVEGEPVVE